MIAAAHPNRFGPGKPGLKTTGQPVWRSSFDIDDPRAQVARPLGDGTDQGAREFKHKWVRVMGEYAELIKQQGKPHQIPANMVKLIERMLWRCTDGKTGRCEVTLERIMEVTNFARPTVVRLLALARHHGFVDWVRRTVRTGNAPDEGPAVKQTANAYFFELARLPIEAARRLRQLMKVKLRIWAERKGSGPVPTLAWRRARSAIGTVSAALQQSESARRAATAERDRLLESLPYSQWAEVLFPGQPEEQTRYNAELIAQGILPQSASSDSTTHSPP